MIQDKTIDEALAELARTMKALQALRAARQLGNDAQASEVLHAATGAWTTKGLHAAAIRASLDLTRKLAYLRSGRR